MYLVTTYKKPKYSTLILQNVYIMISFAKTFFLLLYLLYINNQMIHKIK